MLPIQLFFFQLYSEIKRLLIYIIHKIESALIYTFNGMCKPYLAFQLRKIIHKKTFVVNLLDHRL